MDIWVTNLSTFWSLAATGRWDCPILPALEAKRFSRHLASLWIRKSPSSEDGEHGGERLVRTSPVRRGMKAEYVNKIQIEMEQKKNKSFPSEPRSGG